jgi:hypothetical protein
VLLLVGLIASRMTRSPDKIVLDCRAQNLYQLPTPNKNEDEDRSGEHDVTMRFDGDKTVHELVNHVYLHRIRDSFYSIKITCLPQSLEQAAAHARAIFKELGWDEELISKWEIAEKGNNPSTFTFCPSHESSPILCLEILPYASLEHHSSFYVTFEVAWHESPPNQHNWTSSRSATADFSAAFFGRRCYTRDRGGVVSLVDHRWDARGQRS